MLKSEIEAAAKAHGIKVYDEECDPHSQCSEESGFEAGARWHAAQMLAKAEQASYVEPGDVDDDPGRVVALEDVAPFCTVEDDR